MLFTILLIFALSLGGAALIFYFLLRRGRGLADPLQWLDEFSAASYRPMERLLDNRDYAFLASQRGFEPIIARRLRRQRVRIFQGYLLGMIRDFHRLLKIARHIALFASADQSALVKDLWRLRLHFYCSVAAVEAQLALKALGWGAVDARGLLISFEQIHARTERLRPALAA